MLNGAVDRARRVGNLGPRDRVAVCETMPEIDLSALSGPELRRLLKVAHARGNGSLADRLEWEIAARGAGGVAPEGALPPPPLPQDDGDEPFYRMRTPDAEPLAIERRAEVASSRTSGLPLVGLGVVAGCLLSGAAFWGLTKIDLPRFDLAKLMERPPAPAPRAMTVRPAPVPAAAPPGADQVAAALAPGPFPSRPEPAPPVAQPAPPAPAPVAAAVEAVAPAAKLPPVEVAKAPPKPAPPKTAVAKTETPVVKKEAPPPAAIKLAKAEPAPPRKPPPARDACGRATPADRLVCGDLGLRLLDVELKEAYIRALNARADPVTLGRDQAAWRHARDGVSDPDRLEGLYDQRIRELDAVAAAARSGRPPE